MTSRNVKRPEVNDEHLRTVDSGEVIWDNLVIKQLFQSYLGNSQTTVPSASGNSFPDLLHYLGTIIISPATKLAGVYWNHHVRLSARPSVRSSVCLSGRIWVSGA